jgi:hypothetical protein
MKITAAVLPVFRKFPAEGKIIGRLVVGYGELEVDLCRCVAANGRTLDEVVRTVFRLPGGKRRIHAAAKVGRDTFACLALGQTFDQIICEMRYCLGIRNQFAHCNFYDDNTGVLSFVNVEQLARQRKRHPARPDIGRKKENYLRNSDQI